MLDQCCLRFIFFCCQEFTINFLEAYSLAISLFVSFIWKSVKKVSQINGTPLSYYKSFMVLKSLICYDSVCLTFNEKVARFSINIISKPYEIFNKIEFSSYRQHVFYINKIKVLKQRNYQHFFRRYHSITHDCFHITDSKLNNVIQYCDALLGVILLIFMEQKLKIVQQFEL